MLFAPPLTTATMAGQNWNVTQLMLARLGSTTLTIWSHAIDKARTFYIVSALLRAAPCRVTNARGASSPAVSSTA